MSERKSAAIFTAASLPIRAYDDSTEIFRPFDLKTTEVQGDRRIEGFSSRERRDYRARVCMRVHVCTVCMSSCTLSHYVCNMCACVKESPCQVAENYRARTLAVSLEAV